MTAPLPAHLVDAAAAAALSEDLGLAGDITTTACIPPDRMATAILAARRPGVIAGLDLVRAALRQCDPAIRVECLAGDGGSVAPGDAIARIEGPARGILQGERVALNFFGRLSGVATATAALVKAVEGTAAQIVCTRKTTPGLRAFEKYAVRCGGGKNHRFGLFDAAMIKDNHIVAAGGIALAIRAVRREVGHLVRIEIEVDSIEQLAQALDEGADAILLDNMSLDDLRRAVQMTNGHSLLEASGNVTLDTVRAIADTGVDVISSGAITHSAPCLDVGLDFIAAK